MNTKKLRQYFQIVLGSLLFSLSVNWFIEPNGLNSGGLVGLSQILSFLLCHSGRLNGVINLAFNIPLFVLSYRGISKSFLIKTLTSVLLQSLFFSFLPVLSSPVLPDVLSNCIFGAVIGGIGIGLCLLSGGSAGGMDIMGVYLSKKAPDFSVGKLSYAINLFVLSWSALLFSLQISMYSLIFIVLMYFVSDKVHFQNINVFALIITSNPSVKNEIMEKTGRGVTAWNGFGAYTHHDEEILLCIMNRYEVSQIKKIVRSLDEKAVFLLCSGTPLLGNIEKRLEA